MALPDGEVGHRRGATLAGKCDANVHHMVWWGARKSLSPDLLNLQFLFVCEEPDLWSQASESRVGPNRR